MIQIIITYIILVITFGYVIYKFVKSVISIQKNKSACTSCHGKSCEECPFSNGKFSKFDMIKSQQLKNFN
ncbi:MAG: hypothetical protein U9Q83_11165 [Bacteroidota bacterium]|nr:hypothetical protein [Bacteroidota bacterium]